MKKLLITLLLISPFSFADWGDVYYCQMTSYVVTDVDGTVTQYKQEKFKFKIDEAKKSIVFGKAGYFNNSEQPLVLSSSPSIKEWRASDFYSTLKFEQGKFLYVSAILFMTTSITADCEKF